MPYRPLDSQKLSILRSLSKHIRFIKPFDLSVHFIKPLTNPYQARRHDCGICLLVLYSPVPSRKFRRGLDADALPIAWPISARHIGESALPPRGLESAAA
jgi:hypothetical protein